MPGGTGAPPRATAFDEVDVLGDAGRQEWETMDVGAFALRCRRPHRVEDATQWEYRRVGIDRRTILEAMTTAGWEPRGIWTLFHSFKRNLKRPAHLPSDAKALEATSRRSACFRPG
jgi:hypothetical protein